MKKPIIYGVAVAALAVGGFALSSNSSAPEITPLMAENIEALSDIELEEGGVWKVDFYSTTRWECTYGGSLKCPGTSF